MVHGKWLNCWKGWELKMVYGVKGLNLWIKWFIVPIFQD